MGEEDFIISCSTIVAVYIVLVYRYVLCTARGVCLPITSSVDLVVGLSLRLSPPWQCWSVNSTTTTQEG